jgi:hypothetical protein
VLTPEYATVHSTFETKEFVMRLLTAAIVFAPLMLIGVLPAVAGQPVSLLPSNTPVRLAADTPTATDRDSYMQRAKDEMQEWQRKLHDFGEQGKAKGQTASNATGDELNEAWNKTEAASHKLQTASADGWESAKTTFEKASHNLADTWHRIHPEEK